ncbi:amino acid adenylation domain-containing protein [Scytonema sp. NUACC26]|uniref:amino acid adenylation domain-containing protein n=1 Tax=Scytonema sp. NUACC26 TaxID=3140176 RepID=UPI0034DC5BF7
MQKEINEGYQLSPQQKHLWSLQQIDYSLPYRVQCAVRIEGNLNTNTLKEAIQNVVERHEILRTTFYYLPGMDIPLQFIADTNIALVHEHDLSSKSLQEQDEKIDVLFHEVSQLPFDFEQGPLLYVSLVTLSLQRYVLLISLPAMCADTITLTNLVYEISSSYAVCLHGKELSNEALQYVDLAEWQNELLAAEDTEAGREYWRKQNISALPSLQLPFKNQTTGELRFKPQSLCLKIAPDMVARLQALVQCYNISTSVLLLACWQILLCRLTGQPDIIIGMTYDGRKSGELKSALGLFAKYLPVRCHLEANCRFGEILLQVNQLIWELYEWQEYFTWEQVVESTGSGNRSPFFFPFCFEFEEWSSQYSVADASFSIYKQYACVDRFKVKLSCVQRDDFISAVFHYDANLFKVEDIQRLAAQFQSLLESVAKNPKALISELEILSAREHQQLLVEFNNTKTTYPNDKCIHQLFEEQVDRTPDNVAVVFGNRQLTYRQLNVRANQLAHYLQQQGVEPEVLVGLCVERSLEMVVGLLGILKAGGAYVPLDPTYPSERLTFIIEDTQTPVLLSQQRLAERLPHLQANVVFLDTNWETITQYSEHNPTSGVRANNLSYVLYTSGSTGKPKGVMIQHQGLVNYLSWCTKAYAVTEGQGTPVHSPFGFDLTITSLFSPLLVGKSIVLLPEEQGIEALSNALRTYKDFSLVKITPAHLELLSRLLPATDAAERTKALIIGGEALWEENLSFWRQYAPNTRLINEYGPTETVVGCCVYEVPVENCKSGAVPIGHPIANTEIYLLDQYLHPVPVGVPGELYIGGDGVARGYFNRPDLTAEKFIPNPYNEYLGSRLYKTGDLARHLPDGNIEFLGRIDHQEKIRGFRIELGEIEIALEQHPSVQEATVIAREDNSGNKRLVAYLVPDPQYALTVRQLLRLEREGRLTNQKLYELPNGMIVVHLNKNETDYLYKEIFEEQSYLRHGITLNEDDCIFDVGANIGFFTLFVGQRCRKGVIYAFEPIPPTFQVLRLNTDLYGLDVKVFECGISNNAKSETFTFYPHLSMMSGRFADRMEDREVVKLFEFNQQQVSKSYDEPLQEELLDQVLTERLTSENFTCQLKTISDVIRENHVERIDLLKIDAEKSELDVLAGIQQDDWQKIKQIVIEVQDIDCQLEQVTALLKHHQYSVTFQQESWLKDTNLYNVYALRPFEKRLPTNETITSKLVWNSPNQLISDVRRLLQEKLPDYMVPAAFVLLEELPVTPNGKIDRRALPVPEQEPVNQEKSFAAPRNSVEDKLAQIWAEVLSLKQVGIYNNFFELGGDSILSIQAIAKANQAGLKLTPKQMFKHQTIASLATVAGTTVAIQVEQELITGLVPLTPIQHWFFAQNLPNPHHWNQTILLEVQPDADANLLEQGVLHLLLHHDTLRLRFTQETERWQQTIADDNFVVPFMRLDLSALPPEAQVKVIEVAATELQTSLNLLNCPLMRVIFFDLGAQKTSRLLLVIHHIVVDGVSWRILLEDLQTAYQQISQGESIHLPLKTSSFKQWSNRLQEYAQSENLHSKLDYWLTTLGQPVEPIPVDYPDGNNTEATARTVSVSLSIEETQALLQQVPAAYQTQINDVLLTALIQTFAQWTGKRYLLIDLEGHGREELFEDLDLSRTVGWFTSIFPVRLSLENTSHLGEALKTVKEQLRAIPNRGIDYGVLCYLSKEREIAKHLSCLPQAEVSFNYLGQFDRVLPELSLFSLAHESSGSSRSLQGKRFYVLEISGCISQGKLQMNWTYSEKLHRQTTIESLAQRFIEAMRSLIAHCQSPDAGGFTPSDFAEFKQSQWDQTDLDAITAAIGDI